MALVSMRQRSIRSSTNPGAPRLTPQQRFLAPAMEKSRRIDDNSCFAPSRSL